MNKLTIGILTTIFSLVPMVASAVVIEPFWNADQTFVASCAWTLPPGVNINDWVGPVVTRTVPAHTVSSNISVNDANTIAFNQAKTSAISSLECVQMFRCTDDQSATASCPAGHYFPTPGTFGSYTYTNNSVTAIVLGYSPLNMYGYHSSTVSVAAACAQTLAVAQANANNAATNNCVPIPSGATSTTPKLITPTTNAAPVEVKEGWFDYSTAGNIRVSTPPAKPVIVIPAASSNKNKYIFDWMRNVKSPLTISWKDVSNNEEGFIIERSNYPMRKRDVFVEVGRVKSNTTSFTDKNVKNDADYVYRVASYNTAGKSSYSETVVAKHTRDGYTYSILRGNETSAVFEAINNFIQSYGFKF